MVRTAIVFDQTMMQAGAAHTPALFAFVLLTLPLEFTYPTLFELFTQRLAERSQTLRACAA